MSEPENNIVQIKKYALAYLDVLNQKEALSKIIEFPENAVEQKELISNLKNTFGVIQAYRTGFENVYKGLFSDEKIKEHDILDTQKKIIEKFRSTGIKKQYFSDTLIFYSSLSFDEKKYIPISDVFNLFTTTSSVFLFGLADKLVIRGGIEAGVAWEYPENQIYGPALLHVSFLENKIAQYPRIVIGPKLLEFIDLISKCPGEDDGAKLKRRMAERCLKMLYQDIDGMLSLDYLGEEFRDIFTKDNSLFNVMCDIVEQAMQFVFNEYEQFKRDQKFKLANRYFLLYNYVLSRKNKFWKK